MEYTSCGYDWREGCLVLSPPAGRPLGTLPTPPRRVVLQLVAALAGIAEDAAGEGAFHGLIDLGCVEVSGSTTVVLRGFNGSRLTRAPEQHLQGRSSDVWCIAEIGARLLGGKVASLSFPGLDRETTQLIRWTFELMLDERPAERPSPLEVWALFDDAAAATSGPGLAEWVQANFDLEDVDPPTFLPFPPQPLPRVEGAAKADGPPTVWVERRSRPKTEPGGRTFEVRELLGRGAFANVYRAASRKGSGIETEVALKWVHEAAANHDLSEKLLRDEARLLGFVLPIGDVVFVYCLRSPANRRLGGLGANRDEPDTFNRIQLDLSGW